MKTLTAFAALLLAAPAFACDYCTAALVAPVRVEYRVVTAPQIVRETVTVERQEVVRDPVIVERSEKVLEYQAAPALVAPAYGSAVVGGYRSAIVGGYRSAIVGHHNAVRAAVVVHPAVRAAVVVRQPAVVQKVEVRRGILGRVRQKSVTVIK